MTISSVVFPMSTNWGQAMHICVGKLDIIGSDNGLVPWHYLNQCWNIVNWTLANKLQWNFNWNPNIFIQENALVYVVDEMTSILLRPQCANMATLLYRIRHPGGYHQIRIFILGKIHLKIGAAKYWAFCVKPSFTWNGSTLRAPTTTLPKPRHSRLKPLASQYSSGGT